MFVHVNWESLGLPRWESAPRRQIDGRGEKKDLNGHADSGIIAGKEGFISFSFVITLHIFRQKLWVKKKMRQKQNVEGI